MDFNIVDFGEVQRDLDDHGVATNFNTSFHTAEQAPDLPIPHNSPYAFGRWLPVILRSRDLPASALQIVSLSRRQVGVLVRAAAASVHTRVLNRAYAEDLQDEVAPAFAALAFPPEGLFLRLDACSPKDGAQTSPGRVALHSVDEVLLRLTTSQRALSPLGNMLNGDAPEERLYFLPYDARMNPASEYRVFCVPGSLAVSAVSQYRWHQPWALASAERNEMEARARTILAGISVVHAQIVDSLREPGVSEVDDLARAQGFSFDVLYDRETEACMLVELNTFGVRSACGSCLFHWLRDQEVLYGEASDNVEFRVAL